MQNDSNVINPEQLKELALAYRPNTNQPELSVKTFLRNETVKEYSNKELMQRYVELGYSPSQLADKKDQIFKLSIENKQLHVALKTIESIENNMGLNNKVKLIETLTNSSNLQSNFTEAKKSQVTVEINTPSNEEKTEDKQ